MSKYCGLKEVPKGKKRGSYKYCLENNQVRFYGAEKISKKDLDKYFKEEKKKIVDNNFELKKLEFKARKLVSTAKELNKIINSKQSTKSKKAEAKKEYAKLLKSKENLLKQIKKYKK